MIPLPQAGYPETSLPSRSSLPILSPKGPAVASILDADLKTQHDHQAVADHSLDSFLLEPHHPRHQGPPGEWMSRIFGTRLDSEAVVPGAPSRGSTLVRMVRDLAWVVDDHGVHLWIGEPLSYRRPRVVYGDVCDVSFG